VVAQTREQLSYATLKSPITGLVTQRITEVGNLVQPNGEILRIGDFSRVQVDVEVSELQRANIRVGQSVEVGLDAYPNQIFRGQVSRISPAAEPTARLVPIEVVIPIATEQIGSGLLARVSFESGKQERVLVPETAISQPGQGSGGVGGAGGVGGVGGAISGAGEAGEQGSRGAGGVGEVQQNRKGRVFVVTGGEDGTQATVTARTVTLGEQANDKVEILSD
jgi:multidrug efflux pump subunit AcrA (membrane-fusion protein)